jgi:hypothetical protein
MRGLMGTKYYYSSVCTQTSSFMGSVQKSQETMASGVGGFWAKHLGSNLTQCVNDIWTLQTITIVPGWLDINSLV